ncbi:sulfotransferase [Photobacterium makurazakiensis]|uniref:sulfotransferase n=1 Tax=Photobacterium makurazakiensis TaxID=2910234 RepID=UPI003D12071E
MARICFLLGVMPRSGTNYLSNVLTLHDQCENSAPINEDFIVSQSGALYRFSKKIERYWNPTWDKENKVLTSDNILRHIGNGLKGFISSAHEDADLPHDSVIVTKTPSTKNIKHFFKLFPDSHLFIIMRDGRSVVESGEKSFDWDFEKAAFDWQVSVSRISTFIKDNPEFQDKIMLVKYEDLLTNTGEQINQMFNFIGVEEDSVSINDVKTLKISGSSEVKNTQAEVNWSAVPMNENFKPLERFSSWSQSKRRRFDWVAGKSLYEMKYIEDCPQFSFKERVIQRCWDLTWIIRVAPKTIKFLVKEKKLILKTS